MGVQLQETEMSNIVTNNQPRALLDGMDLTDKEKADFDWLENIDEMSGQFVRYRGQAYCLDEFMVLQTDEGPLADWHGYAAQSAFSAVLIRLDEHNETVTMGLHLS
jgi:hypothetical protein